MKTAKPEQAKVPPKLSAGRASEILWNSIFEAFLLSIMIMILGGLGLSMSAGIWQQMIPASPPLTPVLEAASPAPSSQSIRLFGFFEDHKFAIIYGFTYAGLVLFQLARYSSSAKERLIVRGLRRITRKISDNWFELTFFNAIGAMIGAVVLTAAQQFSLVQIVVHVLLGWLQPVIYQIADLFFNAYQIATVQGLIHWYDANQMKFAFWALYISAVLDDLGLPNLKTIVRRCWTWMAARPGKATHLGENGSVQH
jgi:hypothetical protein